MREKNRDNAFKNIGLRKILGLEDKFGHIIDEIHIDNCLLRPILRRREEFFSYLDHKIAVGTCAKYGTGI